MAFTAALITLLAVLSQVTYAQQAAKPQAAPAGAAATAAVPASNPAGSLHEALAKSTPKFRGLFDVIKLSPATVPKNVVGTMFAPIDAAVDAFLKAMGLTAAEVAAQPDLADLMTAYHFIPGYQVSGTDADKGPKKAATGDENFIVTLVKGPGGKLAVKDVQGNVAGVVSGPVKVGKVSVFVIDRVLMSGNYFNSTMAALAYNPSWVTTYGYAQSTGIDKALAAAKDPYTLFVPTNKAWKPIEPELMAASSAATGDILKYHVTPAARQVPRGFQGVTSLPTLLSGHSIKVTSNLTATAPDRYKNNAVTSPGGFSPSSRTLEAMTAAASGTVPVQYPNRFGSLPEAAAANGCLNCLKWAKP
ncbi:hypothetical protein OEZ85_006788 [Tetradesmus obliquus]|uniref:FAS1 domain-containing protein n=1 Tax=Tetradesmus obliquus TaxID=3088 RepID=A0ABY8TVP1_TETOB|nr:hypothetical protein OEZ85_006788 [Tetradesmus obliquus]